jgi:hypothetical protein
VLGGAFQGILPAIAGLEAALGIEIEKDVVPAPCLHPVANRDGLGIVSTRMAEENPRHRACFHGE